MTAKDTSEPKRSDCKQDCDINCTFPHCIAQSHLSSPEESDPVTLWAEIHRLRAAVQGPDGFETWQEAATAERVRRVAAEKELSEFKAKFDNAEKAGRIEWEYRDGYRGSPNIIWDVTCPDEGTLYYIPEDWVIEERVKKALESKERQDAKRRRDADAEREAEAGNPQS